MVLQNICVSTGMIMVLAIFINNRYSNLHQRNSYIAIALACLSEPSRFNHALTQTTCAYHPLARFEHVMLTVLDVVQFQKLSVLICFRFTAIYAIYSHDVPPDPLERPARRPPITCKRFRFSELMLLTDPAVCPNQCGRSYKGKFRKNSLKRHLFYECGVEPQFACPACNKRFADKGSMRRHALNVHRIIPNKNNHKIRKQLMRYTTS